MPCKKLLPLLLLLVGCVSSMPCFPRCRFGVCSGSPALYIRAQGETPALTAPICAKSASIRIGIIGSTGEPLVFLPGKPDAAPVPISSYSPTGLRQSFPPSFLKSQSLSNNKSAITHETPQQNQRDVLDALCVVVPIKSAQQLSDDGNVIANIQSTSSLTDCVALTLQTSSQSPSTSPVFTVSPSPTPTSATTPSSSPSPSSEETPSPSSTSAVTTSPSSTPVPTISPLLTPSESAKPTASATPSPLPSAVIPAVSLDSPSPSTFNAPSPLVFSVSGATFDLDVNSVTLLVNNNTLAASALNLTSKLLIANANLIPGSNNISLQISLAGNASVLKITPTIWIGTETLTVNLVDGNGNQFLKNTTVTAVLSDDLSVQAESVTTTGSVVFENVPSRTIVIEARSVDNDVGTTGAIGSQNIVSISMASFGNLSSVENNDFSKGTEGWEIQNPSSVSLVDHVENVGPQGNSSLSVSERQTSGNKDLQLTTVGEGPQTVSRTFRPKFGTTGIRVRYRFITEEVPGGFFGSQFNDYFSVSIRSKEAGGNIFESATMNGLGLAAFDVSTGSTAWRQTILPLKSDFDVVEVMVTVANVEDGALDSTVVVDFVEELNCNLGERVEAVAAIGLIDALTARSAANEAFAAARATGFPGAHNGKQDAFRHCFWNCRMAQEIGTDQAKEVGDLHELCGNNEAAETAMDLKNNAVGRGYGTPGSNCTTLCTNGAENGDLQTAP